MISSKQSKLRKAMPATEMLCHLAGINSCQLSKVELFARLYVELKKIFKLEYKSYFRLMKFNLDMEEEMLDAKFLSCVISDILSTEEYTLPGIANYVLLFTRTQDKPQDDRSRLIGDTL
jgi:hypothetical protein